MNTEIRNKVPTGTDPCESFPINSEGFIDSGFRGSLQGKLLDTFGTTGTDPCESFPETTGTDPYLNLQKIHQVYRTLTQLLIEKHLTITTMESCTSGFIASLITDTEGSSAVIKGACITYSNEAKIKNGVRPQIIEDYGVYSTQTAQEMAESVLKIYPSDIGIGITGTFGNVDPNNSDSVPGKVFFAISIKGQVIVKELELPKNISRFESKLYVAQEIFSVIYDSIK